MEEKKNKKIIVISIVVAIVILAIIAVAVYMLTNSQQLKLYNNTLELGQENYVEQITEADNIYIKEGYTYTVKDNKIDINNVGTYNLTFEIKGKGKTTEETKQIQVVDTTPPKVELKQDTFYIGDNINVEEIVKIQDLSQEGEIAYNEANAKIEGQFDTSKEGETQVTISVTDKNGNTGTQELKIKVESPKISVYDYITRKIKEYDSSYKNYSIDTSNNKFTIKYKSSLAEGWINFTDKVAYETYSYSGSYLSFSSSDIMYFDKNYKVYKVEQYANYDYGSSVMNWYLGKTPKRTIKSNDSDIDLYQIKDEIDSINEVLENKNGKINLVGKDVNQLKKETIDLRELK